MQSNVIVIIFPGETAGNEDCWWQFSRWSSCLETKY